MSSTSVELESLDLETPRIPLSDPLRLSSALKSPAEIKELISGVKTHSRLPFSARLPSSSSNPEGNANNSSSGNYNDNHLKKKPNAKALKSFYESQNAHIERMLKPVDDHRKEAKGEQDDTRLRFLIAVHGSLAANILLAVLQAYAAITSGSLSIFATMIDSVFDPLSNLLLMFSHRAIKTVDASRFPSGKARLETAGNIGFAFLMIAVSLALIALSVHDLAAGSPTATNQFHLMSVIAVAIALVTKLILFAYCFTLRKTYSQVAILWRDHRNDLPINTFGLVTSVIGSKLAWWVDPFGAIIIGLAIMFAWSHVVYQESLLLIGVAAPQDVRGLITYISMTHDDRITHIDTVRAYHSGPRLIVEVDIVMEETMTLRDTHDVAESLQIKLEGLPDVERAYVHVDFETLHAPEHNLKKEL